MSKKTHRLKKLQAAEFVDKGPFPADPKLKGKALEGIRYQSKIHRVLTELPGDLYEEQWIRFIDNGRYHYCRPDSILVNYDRVIVVESKLSLRQLRKGISQVKLYKPILEHIFNRPTVGVIAFKHWILGSEDCLPMIGHPEELLSMPTRGLNSTLGWNHM
jgi:hypothetical protein